MGSPHYPELLKEVEARLAKLVGTRYALVTSSGREALRIALLSLNVKEGNVILPNIVCSIVPQGVLSCGLKPLVVDTDESLSLDLECLQRHRSEENRIILLVYLYGCPAEGTAELLKYARANGLLVVEDAAQSFGARIGGKYAGSLGDVGIFSFSKGFFGLLRGGAITTDREDVADRARHFRDNLEDGKLEGLRMRLRYAQANAPYRIKRLYRRIFPVAKQNLARLAQYDLSSEYFHLDEDPPLYHRQLMNFELGKCLQQIGKRETISRQREILVQEIMETISRRSALKTLSSYNPDWVYTRIPAFIQEGKLSTWREILGRGGVYVDMVYRPLAQNTYFRDKCLFLPAYPRSDYISRHLLPLPVDSRLITLLRSIQVI